ncbi:MAG: O-antigen ligase family protein [Bryobacter sp.]|nr:O-antigen ligase family protein [Bryobacter sp.]
MSLLTSIPLVGGIVVASAQISPWVGLGALGGGAIVLAMFVFPTASLVAVAISLPLERIGRITEDFSSFTISLSRIVGLIALVALFLQTLIVRRKLRFGLAFWMYAGYTFFAVVGTAWALQQPDAIRDSQRIIGNLLFFFLIINLVTRYELVRLGVMAWLLSSTASSVYGIYQYHFGAVIGENQMGSTRSRFSGVVEDDAETATLGTKVKRAYGTTSHPGLFGLNLAMTLPFFVWAMRGQRPLLKAAWLAAMAICTYGILISNTRFTMVISALMILITLVRGLWDFKPVVFAALGLAALASIPLIPSDIYMRAFDPKLYSSDKSAAIRIRFKMLDKSLDLVSEHWLLGIGVGNQDIIPAMITDELGGRITPDGVKASAHNEFVWTLVEVGIFGWLFHWGFVALIIVSSFRASRQQERAIGRDDQYWFLIAAQTVLLCVPLYGVQSEVFHYALKGWWFAAGIVWVIWTAVKHLPPRQLAVAPGKELMA